MAEPTEDDFRSAARYSGGGYFIRTDASMDKPSPLIHAPEMRAGLLALLDKERAAREQAERWARELDDHLREALDQRNAAERALAKAGERWRDRLHAAECERDLYFRTLSQTVEALGREAPEMNGHAPDLASLVTERVAREAAGRDALGALLNRALESVPFSTSLVRESDKALAALAEDRGNGADRSPKK